MNEDIKNKILEIQVNKVADAIMCGDNMSELLNVSDTKHKEWRITLDKAFKTITEFAERNGIKIKV